VKGARAFLSRIRKTGVRRPGTVTLVAMGRERTFEAYDLGDDLFIFEKGVGRQLDARPSVLIAEKSALRRRARGRVLTMSTGNHAVAAFPLLDGRFWRLSTVPAPNRGDVLVRDILCANVVGGKLELSQREVSAEALFKIDSWLREAAGFGLDEVVMADRNEAVLEHYRRLGQEWRVKPLEWGEAGMRCALAASQKRISTKVRYYHSVRGVHFLSFPEFCRFVDLAQTAPEDFVAVLKELVSVFEGNATSFTRMVKHRGHHEVELFGVPRGVAVEKVVPELEKLMESIALGRIGQLGVIQKANEIAALYRSLLAQPELADETSGAFVSTLYMCVTGEVYAIAGEGATPAFDDRRMALPGATFENGRPVYHPGVDVRTELFISNVRGMMSKDEDIEYANVYVLRDDHSRPGETATYEIVFKTTMRPLETSFVIKRLSNPARGYSSYVLARIGALRALGVSLSGYYRLLRRRASGARQMSYDYYVRLRCPGETLESIPACYFCTGDDSSVEETSVVLGVARLLGDAAAQNLAMKKYDAATQSPLYGIGKELYDFEYDNAAGRVEPKGVSTCSIRGSFGWPCTDTTEENLARLFDFYLTHYARTLAAFRKRHSVPMADLVACFWEGFAFRTNVMEWQSSVMRDRFEDFAPPVPPAFGFARRWRFLVWALGRQKRRLPQLLRLFNEKVESTRHEDDRNHPQ
jgi:hypothetical protein